LIVDPLTDVFDGNENIRRDVRAFVGALRRMVSGPVIMFGHVNRQASQNPRFGDLSSGSTAWHNSCRARFELSHPGAESDDDEDGGGAAREPPEDDGARTLYQPKNNDGRARRTIDAKIDFANWTIAAATGSEAAGGELVESIRQRVNRRWLVDAIRDAEAAGEPVHSGERSNRNAHVRLRDLPGFPACWRGKKGKAALFRELLAAKRDGELIENAITTASRNRATVWGIPAGSGVRTADEG
jgi:hypothetical protein